MRPTLFGSNVERLLSASNRKQKDLASFCEVSGATVSDWISGKTKEVEGRHLVRAAAFFEVDAGDLLNSEINPHETREQVVDYAPGPIRVNLNTVPVTGVIQSETTNEIDSQEGAGARVPASRAVFATNHLDAYALLILSDDLRPRFKPGESIVCSPNKSFEAGHEVVVKLRSGRRLVRVFDWRRNGLIQLSSVNELGARQTFVDDEVEIIHRIIGSVQADMHITD